MILCKFSRLAVVLLITAVAGACGGSVFHQPQVTLQSVQLGGIGVRGGTLLFNVEIINPNRFSLSADQLTYKLAVGDPDVSNDTTWIDFASGTYAEAFSVGARDTAVVQIPVEFTYSAIGAAREAIMGTGTFTYRAIGTVDVRTPLGGREVPFSKRGTVSLFGGG